MNRVAAAIALLLVALPAPCCSSRAKPGETIINGKAYFVGEKISFGPHQGWYCATIDTAGTRAYPNARHFAIARQTPDCSPVVHFFRDWLAAGTPNIPGSEKWMNISVGDVNAYDRGMGGYTATFFNDTPSPYGKITGFALTY